MALDDVIVRAVNENALSIVGVRSWRHWHGEVSKLHRLIMCRMRICTEE